MRALTLPLAAASLLAIVGRPVAGQAAHPTLQVLASDSAATFRLHATNAAIRIGEDGWLHAGGDTLLTAPVRLELMPGGEATIDGAGSVLVEPADTASRRYTQLIGARIRLSRDAAGRYLALEAQEGRQVTLSVF